jgi:hypothetical protein
MPTEEPTSFNEWISMGMSMGYCTAQFCQTHEGSPMHPSEEAAWDRGDDPCSICVRIGAPKDWALEENEEE